ncbi:hypothetical protein DVH24_000122 [Malus domestica]|uniref:Uncharacterized protein n=1 Tax=Malus domestica TaxID=3750 RepID=A0A498J3V0_MALDO|nr:hypothetical protein DVH24_000122 [Malus domestica]
MMKKARTTSLPIQSLSDELLVQKLTKVASLSFNDLFLAKMISTKSAKMTRLFEHINIRKFEDFNLLSLWSNNEDVSKFLKRCTNCGNSNIITVACMLG